MKIGFIGIGRMGAGMARNLLRAGYELTVFNRRREKAEALAGDGARVASTPGEACRDAEAVVTMLADDPAVEQVVFGDDGIAAALKDGAVHICSATISTAFARKLTREHGSRRQGYVSAPVFGRPEAAEGKKLLVVPAGPAGLTERCRPIFDAVGRQTFVIGSEPWQANAAKLCGNFMIASMIETFGEAYAVLRKSGVAPGEFLEIITALFGSPVYSGYGRIIAEEKFEPAGFALRLGLKDVKLMLAAAEECGAPLPIASLIHDHLLTAMGQGQADMDWSSVAKVAARSAGL